MAAGRWFRVRCGATARGDWRTVAGTCRMVRCRSARSPAAWCGPRRSRRSAPQPTSTRTSRFPREWLSCRIVRRRGTATVGSMRGTPQTTRRCSPRGCSVRWKPPGLCSWATAASERSWCESARWSLGTAGWRLRARPLGSRCIDGDATSCAITRPRISQRCSQRIPHPKCIQPRGTHRAASTASCVSQCGAARRCLCSRPRWYRGCRRRERRPHRSWPVRLRRVSRPYLTERRPVTGASQNRLPREPLRTPTPRWWRTHSSSERVLNASPYTARSATAGLVRRTIDAGTNAVRLATRSMAAMTSTAAAIFVVAADRFVGFS
jgi:hypothetical protein